MKIVSDYGFPKGDGSLPTDEPFARFKNEREYIAQSGRMKPTLAAMDWAVAEIEALVKALQFYADHNRYDGPNQRLVGADPYTPEDQGYRQDVIRDNGAIAREALAKMAEGQA